MAQAMSDYFPLVEGLALEYRSKSHEGDGGYRFEVVSAVQEGAGTVAHCRRIPSSGGRAYDFTARKDAAGVFCGKSKEFPLPAEPGRRWTRAPNSYEIAAVDAVKMVPAGTFRGCLRVVYRIAGGDAGCGERLYAPGVGFIYEMCADEADPFEILLVRAVTPDII